LLQALDLHTELPSQRARGVIQSKPNGGECGQHHLGVQVRLLLGAIRIERPLPAMPILVQGGTTTVFVLVSYRAHHRLEDQFQ